MQKIAKRITHHGQFLSSTICQVLALNHRHPAGPPPDHVRSPARCKRTARDYRPGEQWASFTQVETFCTKAPVGNIFLTLQNIYLKFGGAGHVISICACQAASWVPGTSVSGALAWGRTRGCFVDYLLTLSGVSLRCKYCFGALFFAPASTSHLFTQGLTEL